MSALPLPAPFAAAAALWRTCVQHLVPGEPLPPPLAVFKDPNADLPALWRALAQGTLEAVQALLASAPSLDQAVMAKVEERDNAGDGWRLMTPLDVVLGLRPVPLPLLDVLLSAGARKVSGDILVRLATLRTQSVCQPCPAASCPDGSESLWCGGAPASYHMMGLGASRKGRSALQDFAFSREEALNLVEAVLRLEAAGVDLTGWCAEDASRQMRSVVYGVMTGKTPPPGPERLLPYFERCIPTLKERRLAVGLGVALGPPSVPPCPRVRL